ncbi:MAG TPA: bifunctional phosphoribosylaminoimidazolecarboxamide formyltransferase/IMP cyclohydrolase [Treponemataceae bacterium]|nr:bifunctional phosphoribosylaminoimidazolecarboxamide formyltransferase/IMP cyclohydrolase [Treponemataceae bacterium]
MKKRALISVYEKNGILELAHYLKSTNWEIISTGGTAAYLKDNAIPVTDVSSITGFAECLDGRVKTLHPKIHAGLLARRDEPKHLKQLKDLDIAPIDLVCVNLYPFFEKVQEGLSFSQTLEFIDIGGPTMLRSAAKNYNDVIVITEPDDYVAVADEMKQGAVSFERRRELAAKVFNLTSAYDAAVSRFMFNSTKNDTSEASPFPTYYTMPLIKHQELRYGENSHQKAALYLSADRKGAFGGMKQLHGKALSYNNIRDVDVAWKGVCAFNTFVKNAKPMQEVSFGDCSKSVFTIALKHNTPCGAALGKTPFESYKRTFDCDPVSIFGGIVGTSAIVDKDTAEEMKNCFLEVIVAPGFTNEARAILQSKKNLRLIRAQVPSEEQWDCTSVDGGVLVQNRDAHLFDTWTVVTKAQPSQSHIEEMVFGMTIALFAKSNACLVIKNKAAVGIGCGQTSRIWAAEQALERAQNYTKNLGIDNAQVLVSDAFFPFDDSVRKAATYGIKAIVQPGGSIRDQDSIDACNELGISMVFTGTRHFKH